MAAAFEAHGAAIYRYAARLTGSPDIAEDVVQETFVRLTTKPPPSLENLRPWLFTVATHLAHDETRARRRRWRLLAARADRQPLSDPPPDPAAQAASADLAGRVQVALADLPARDRQALLLRSEGFTHHEIASAIGTTTKSVGTIIARALVKLDDRLDLSEEDV